MTKAQDKTPPLSRRNLLAAAAGASVVAASPLAGATLPASSVRRWDSSTDVLVLGSGAAGICAAIEARDAGVEVAVLEALPQPGGASALSGGVIYAGGGTALQQALGINDSVEAMYDFLVAASGPQLDREKAQRYCEDSAAHFDWVRGHGVSYSSQFFQGKGLPMGEESLYFSGGELAWPAREIARPAPRGHVPGEPGMNGGRSLMRTLLEVARSRAIVLQTHARARHLVTESDGRITGVVVEVAGVPQYWRARRGVVLACGGFVHNKAMLQLYAPQLAASQVPWGGAGEQGDGINMGIAAGAAAPNLHQGFAISPIYPPEQVIAGVVVNGQGQRFLAEDAYHGVIGDRICYQQAGRAFLVCDAESAYPQLQDNFPIVASTPSLGELARAANLPSGALQHTVAYYNRHAELGADPLFNKDPRYIRPLRGRPYTLYDLSLDRAFTPVHTLGGLRTTVDGAVLNSWGEAIPGLFAAGRTTAGLPGAPYIASGLSLGDCTYFGRRAGRSAARELA